jgi:hypothetical protein
MVDLASQRARAAELLEASATAFARLAPADAAAMAAGAALLRQAPPATPPRLLTAAAKRATADTVRAWMLRRLESWPAETSPPTQAADIEAARTALPGVPRGYIIRARPPEWPLKEGRPKTRR